MALQPTVQVESFTVQFVICEAVMVIDGNLFFSTSLLVTTCIYYQLSNSFALITSNGFQ